MSRAVCCTNKKGLSVRTGPFAKRKKLIYRKLKLPSELKCALQTGTLNVRLR